jgi:hypothetical protein
MTNYFALLGLSESLTLDPDAVELAWREANTKLATGNDVPSREQDVIGLNEARATLTEITARLAHWLEFKDPAGQADRAIDPSLMDLFSAISPVLESTDALIDRIRRATTALSKAILTREAIAAQLSVQELLRHIQSAKMSLAEQFASLEAAGVRGEFTSSWKCLGQLKFLSRWDGQCRERLLSLIEL